MVEHRVPASAFSRLGLSLYVTMSSHLSFFFSCVRDGIRDRVQARQCTNELHPQSPAAMLLNLPDVVTLHNSSFMLIPTDGYLYTV